MMNEILKNLHILSKTYNELYKCCEEICRLCLDLNEKECITKKKNFKELLKKYEKSEQVFFDEVNIIKKNIEIKLDQFQLLQNNLKIKDSLIEILASRKNLS